MIHTAPDLMTIYEEIESISQTQGVVWGNPFSEQDEHGYTYTRTYKNMQGWSIEWSITRDEQTDDVDQLFLSLRKGRKTLPTDLVQIEFLPYEWNLNVYEAEHLEYFEKLRKDHGSIIDPVSILTQDLDRFQIMVELMRVFSS